MKKPLNNNEEIRKKIIGLGEDSARKTYYPQLQKQLEELKQKNAALEESNKKYLEANMAMQEAYAKNSAILKCLPDLMFTFNEDGVILDYYANHLLKLHVPPQEFINKPVTTVLPHDVAALTLQSIKNTLETKTIQQYTYQLNNSGIIMTFEARMIYLTDTSTLAIVRDITETRQLIEDLKDARNKAEQSDKLKTAFLANMSHEIRTPMNGIIGFSQLLKDQQYTEEQRNKFANTVISSSKQLLSIVNDILDVSLIESGTMKLHPSGDSMGNIMKDIRDIYIPMAAERNLGFTINCELSDLQVFTDISKLKQILNNLLSNAFKFSREGSVTLTVEKINDNILFHVLDTGIGIPEDKREAVFQRFMQVEVEISRQYGGTGLGLSISLELAKLLQGSLQLLPQEENRKGSHFLLSVPRIIQSKQP